ncbi:hypothetical protein ALP94_02334 [Pseudomonas savastanoi pv. glycinea]|uniref:hypothetical protein n=1 Tax=Pseudomonas quasicaspiana TaxID=2829821 RepID=UPI000F00DFD4|nr:hypothetical protein [Pseudomonas quasicaspiana]MCD5979509.1 hypothetical protein [Pseudomonas quasicaspiana]RMR00559.1 hypothetical protein ALP94_02334 [Pseudomonas savastanoi pv. glycinea]
MAEKWVSLETFTVVSAAGGGRLFWNGLQAVKLRVAIKAVDINNHPVVLSEKELRSIKLVNHHGGAAIHYREPLPGLPSPVSSQHGWDWSRVNPYGYDYVPTSSQQLAYEEPSVKSRNTHYVDLYVRTVRQVPLTVSLTVERDDGIQFDSRGHGEGNMTITPLRPTTYPVDRYKFEIVHTMEVGRWGRLDYIPLVLNDNGVNIEFRSISVSPVGVGYHAGSATVTRVGMVSGSMGPGINSIMYPHPRPPGAPASVTGITPVRGQPAIVTFRDRWLSPGKVKNATITAIDMYGNSHTLRFRIVNPERVDGRLELY